MPQCPASSDLREQDALATAGKMPALQRSLVLLGRGTHRQLAEQAQHLSGGVLIGKVFERYGGGKVGRGGLEADVQKVLVPPCRQRVDHGREFRRPFVLGSQNHRSRTAEGPGPRLGRCFFHRVSRPPAADHIQMKAGRESHIRFESQSLSLLAPMAEKPLHWKWTRL